MVDFLDTTTPEEKAERLGHMLPDEKAWRDASVYIYSSITEAFYDVARLRNYHAGESRGHLAMNLLFHLANLSVESGISKEDFLRICVDGYTASMEIADEEFETAGNA